MAKTNSHNRPGTARRWCGRKLLMASCKYATLPFAAPANGTMDESNEFPMLAFRLVKTVLSSEERRSIWPVANISSAASGMNTLGVGAERGCLGLSFDTEKQL